MDSLHPELILVPLLEAEEGTNAGQEEEHGHVPAFHTVGEPESNQMPVGYFILDYLDIILGVRGIDKGDMVQ